jgi:hypothetical protein
MKPALERFRAKVRVDPDTGCHLWTGAVDTRKYPHFWDGERGGGARRFAYQAFVGPIPDGMLVVTRCGTRACVNPEHLFVSAQRPAPAARPRGIMKCSVDGCEREAKARGWCQAHYQRWYKHGDVLWTWHRPTVRERFAAKVEPDPDTGCHLWTGARNPAGYGRLKVGKRMVKAHRFAYEAFVGPIPNGLHVLHRCDTPACVNPEHLFLGTDLDNARDRDAKGRHVPLPGELHGKAKLTAEGVRAIRARWAAGETQLALSRALGVGTTTVANVVHRRTWRHIP